MAEPDKAVTGEFTLTNPEGKPVRVSIFVDRWLMEEGRDATSWIKVSPQEVNIPANDYKVVKYTAKAPRGTSGEYTSSVVFRATEPIKLNDSMGGIAQLRVAMYVIIKGTEDVNCEITTVEVLGTKPLKISVKVKNSGNIHIRPKGKIELLKVADTKGAVKENKVGDLSLNPIEGPIFPNGEGEIGPKSDDMKLEPGTYKAKVSVEFTPEVSADKEIEFSVPERQEAQKGVS